MSKVFVIGIDGCSPDLIEKWKDELPNFKKLIDNGVFGKLESTIPPYTCPAWNSMITGKNPGKINIFDWLTFDGKNIKMSNLNFQKADSIWDVLSDYQKKVCVFNVPVVYPPKKINGIMVCGILTPPGKDVIFTYPPALKNELDRITNGYEILPPVIDVKSLNQLLDKHLKAAKYLIGKYEWDFLMMVFFASDPIQHSYWHYHDETHPKFNKKNQKKYGNIVKEFYKKIDDAIGELLLLLPEDANIFIVSDHGFGPLYGNFLINEWLKKEGFLKLKEQRRSTSDDLLELVVDIKRLLLSNLSPEVVALLAKIIPYRLLNNLKQLNLLKSTTSSTLDNIDWSRTRAYGFGELGQIYINLKGRNPNGIVSKEDYEHERDKIISKLLKIRSPYHNKSFINDIFKKEDLYSGKYFDNAPDIVYIMENMSFIQSTRVGSKKLLADSNITGSHRLYGTFIASGPDIIKGEKFDIKIYDIFPTVLYLLDAPLPLSTDGKVLYPIIIDEKKNNLKTGYNQKNNKIKEKIKNLKLSNRV